jgi:signal transduction histidine kinase
VAESHFYVLAGQFGRSWCIDGFFFIFLSLTPEVKFNLFTIALYIVFGMVIGFCVALVDQSAGIILEGLFSWRRRLILLQLLIDYLLGTMIFYFSAQLFFGLLYNRFPPQRIHIFVSLSVGVAATMISLFFRCDEKNKEKLRLEKENGNFAVIQERNRIARELHDSVCQNLFGISLNLNTLNQLSPPEQPQLKEIILRLQEMVAEVQTEMRLMIYELHPVALAEKGFFETIDNLVSLFHDRYGLEISCQIDGNDENLDDKIRLVLYRVLQESLNNIIKHANASNARVSLQINNGEIKLVIQDNGKGFVVGESHQKGCIGINGMKERVAQINGQFDLESIPGKGTMICVKIR